MKDIADSYKSCGEENERLTRKVAELKAAEATSHENFRRCENELITIRSERDHLRMKQKELLEEIGQFEQHIQHQNIEIQRSHSRLNNMEQQARELSDKNQNIKSVASYMESSTEDYKKKLAFMNQELVTLA